VGECFFWYRPTRVVLDQRPLNGCVCVLLMMLFVVHFQFLVAYIMTDDCVLLLLVRFSRVYVGKFAITAHFAVAAFVPIQNVSSVIIV